MYIDHNSKHTSTIQYCSKLVILNCSSLSDQNFIDCYKLTLKSNLYSAIKSEDSDVLTYHNTQSIILFGTKQTHLS